MKQLTESVYSSLMGFYANKNMTQIIFVYDWLEALQ